MSKLSIDRMRQRANANVLRPMYIFFVVVVVNFLFNTLSVQKRVLATLGGDGTSHHPPQQQQQQQVIKSSNDEPVINVLLAMYGTEDGFLQEIEVFLKSLLLNSPRSSKATVNVYILTNQAAYETIGPTIFHRMGIEYPKNDSSTLPINNTANASSRLPLTWWLPVNIHVINVKNHADGWMEEVRSLRLRSNESLNVHLYDIHTEGTFYRLFANRVLPVDVKYYIYSDSDVVFLTDISALWELTKFSPSEILFHWSKPRNAGFLVVKNSAELWDLISNVDLAQLNDTWYEDQKLLVLIQKNHPDRVKILPNEWNFALEWGYYNKHNLQEIRPQLGMGHFNGNGGTKGAWWTLPDNVGWMRFHDKRDPLFSSFLYYVDMPWSQAQYLAHSKMRYKNETGYPVRAVYIEDPSTWNVSKAYQPPREITSAQKQ